MLVDKNAAANIAVKDLTKAKKFYEDMLGLKEIGRFGDEVITFKSGNSEILVYRSEFAGTNKATAMTWTLDGDLESTVRELKAKGVAFEHLDMPGLRLVGDVHVGDGMKVAWFKDPDGNTLCLAGA